MIRYYVLKADGTRREVEQQPSWETTKIAGLAGAEMPIRVPAFFPNGVILEVGDTLMWEHEARETE